MKLGDIGVSRQGNLAVINHNKFQIQFNLSKGTWDYIDDTGHTIIHNGCTQITLNDGSTVKTEDAGTREFITELPQTDAFGTYHQIRFSHEATDKHIRLNTYLNCYAEQPYILLKVGVENLQQEPLELNTLTLLGVSTNNGAVNLGGTPSDYHHFVNMPPTAPGVSRRLYDGFLLNENNTTSPCHDGALHDTDSQRGLVFGFLTSEKWWPRIQVGYKAKKAETSGVNPWALYHQCEQQQCSFGEEVTSESVYLNFVGGTAAAYQHYTELVAAQNNAQKTEQIVSGWSVSVTQAKLNADSILEQTNRLAKSPLFQPNSCSGIRYIQLESDWQSRLGDYTLNAEDFPDGMRTVVNQIQEKGFKTGTRIDPFCAALDSELVQKHPDYCLQVANAAARARPAPRGKSRSRTKKRGNSAKNKNQFKPASIYLSGSGKEVALLDVSHPDAQAYIRKRIKQIVGEWGYGLIKADFSSYTTAMMFSVHNLKWHDSSLTSAQLYRLAIQLLKDAVNETENEVILAGYNLIAGPGIGSFALSSPLLRHKPTNESDAWHQQKGTKHRLSRYAAHLREHNTLWSQVFGELTVGEPRPINEAIVEMTAAALSGGAIFCADSLATLKPPRAEFLAKIFPLTGKVAKPVDLYEAPFPRIWSLPVSTPYEAWNLTAVFNWKDQDDDVHLELNALGLAESKEYLAHDFWMRQYLGQVSHSVTLLNIPPRSVKLLCFREEQNVPQLLATDMHYKQGSVEILSAGWDSQGESYLLVCQPLRLAEGTCFIHVPEDYLPIGVAAYGSDYRYSWDKPICKLTFGPTETLIHANIRFAKTSGGTRQTR